MPQRINRLVFASERRSLSGGQLAAGFSKVANRGRGRSTETRPVKDALGALAYYPATSRRLVRSSVAGFISCSSGVRLVAHQLKHPASTPGADPRCRIA